MISLLADFAMFGAQSLIIDDDITVDSPANKYLIVFKFVGWHGMNG
jgi:hypothetical protein